MDVDHYPSLIFPEVCGYELQSIVGISNQAILRRRPSEVRKGPRLGPEILCIPMV